MKRSLVALAAALITSAGAIAAFHLLRPIAAEPSSLASLVPQGALIEIEAKDLSSLVQHWNGSKEKHLWLDSDNYEVFSRSRLYLRLDQSRQEFASAAGFPPDMSFLDAVAGSRTALAIYDIGKLEFLYVTRMQSAKVAETVLWQNRGHYETRDVNGQTFYVKTDLTTQRTVAFASTPDYLLLATREDLLAGALKLADGNHPSGAETLSDESWWSQAVGAVGGHSEPDVRIVLNLQGLVRSPYFRSYWIQDNVTELQAFTSATCDAYLGAGEVHEERVFVLGASAEAAAGSALSAAASDGLANLVMRIPRTAGFYRGWAAPTTDATGELLGGVLAPEPGRLPASHQAPDVNLGNEAGSAGDLESRIDRAPPHSTERALDTSPIKTLLENDAPRAVLEVSQPMAAPDGVLADRGTAILVEGATDWDNAGVRSALQSSIEGLWTTSNLGSQWVEEQAGERRYYRLGGLASLAVATDGPLLALSSDSTLLAQILGSQGDKPSSSISTPPLSYTAGLRLDLEREPYRNMMKEIDYAGATGGRFASAGPRFFSFNVESLLDVAARVSSATVVVRDGGKTVQQTVTYKLADVQSGSQQ